jgi:multimeric flavodoxin WrbA
MSDLEESDMALNALFLNCTLKKSPEISNTSVLIGESRKIFEKEGVETEEIRVVDYHVPYGIAHRVGNDDEWPEIFEKIMRAQILVIGTAIWLGEKTSVASKAVERMYGSSGETNDLGQYIYYNKVGGVLATGNEDGGKEVSRSILYALQHSAPAHRLHHPSPGRCLLGRRGGAGAFLHRCGDGKRVYEAEYPVHDLQPASPRPHDRGDSDSRDRERQRREATRSRALPEVGAVPLHVSTLLRTSGRQ